jgi:hypothetical protein
MSKFYSDDFWGRVRQRLLDMGMNMTDLSRVSGLPYGSIYRQINAGIVPTKPEYLDRMASALGCSVDYLLTGERRESNTLSPELMDMVTHFKVLTDGQKRAVMLLMEQFTRDNQKYAEVYLQLHPVET